MLCARNVSLLVCFASCFSLAFPCAPQSPPPITAPQYHNPTAKPNKLTQTLEAGMCIQEQAKREAVLELIDSCRQRTGWPIKPLGEELQAFWDEPENVPA